VHFKLILARINKLEAKYLALKFRHFFLLILPFFILFLYFVLYTVGFALYRCIIGIATDVLHISIFQDKITTKKTAEIGKTVPIKNQFLASDRRKRVGPRSVT